MIQTALNLAMDALEIRPVVKGVRDRDVLGAVPWIIYPYFVLTIFIVGHLYRFNTNQFGWTSK